MYVPEPYLLGQKVKVMTSRGIIVDRSPSSSI